MKVRWTLGILVIYTLLFINVDKLVAEKTWTQRADMPTPRSAFSTCVVNGKVFVIGGAIEKFGDISISIVEMYDPKTDTWEQKADMPTARVRPSAAVVDGKIYAIGGSEMKKFRVGPGWGYTVKLLATVEMYDPATDTWTKKADMPAPRSGSSCVVDGKVYLIGGANKKQHRLENVEVYDPSTDTWARAKSMNHARSGAAISVVDGKIYVMGGVGWPQIPNHPGPFLSSVEVFNPKTNQWREKKEMPAPKSNHTASVIDGKIYVIGGGFRGKGLYTYLSTIETYDPKTDRWTQEPDMPIAKSGHDAIVINGAIYVFGGNSGGGEDPLVTVEVYGAEEIFQSVDPAGKLVKTWGTIKTGGN